MRIAGACGSLNTCIKALACNMVKNSVKKNDFAPLLGSGYQAAKGAK
jgi:hypothetical protein